MKKLSTALNDWLSSVVWCSASDVKKNSIPESLYAWITDKTSMTKRLQSYCQQAGDLRVVKQNWEYCLANEAATLNIATTELVFVREIFICHQDKPWIYGRSIFPKTSLTPQLQTLGNQSLGDILFADPSLQRGDFMICVVCCNALASTVWGRQSMFHLSHKPILLTEIFLPDMLQIIS